MSFQSACIRGCKITLVAFVWLFSTVRFQMSPQIACLRRGIVTLLAFLWLFSTVRFQMGPQIASLRRCIITQVAFVWLLSTVYLQMFPQWTWIRVKVCSWCLLTSFCKMLNFRVQCLWLCHLPILLCIYRKIYLWRQKLPRLWRSHWFHRLWQG